MYVVCKFPFPYLIANTTIITIWIFYDFVTPPEAGYTYLVTASYIHLDYSCWTIKSIFKLTYVAIATTLNVEMLCKLKEYYIAIHNELIIANAHNVVTSTHPSVAKE